MAELIPSHVQKGLARVYHESRIITPTQLVVAVENHDGHGEDAGMKLSAASAAVARVPPLFWRRWRRRWCRQQQRRARQHGSKSAGSSAMWECHRCGQRGHIARNCMKSVKWACHRCGQRGHIARNCLAPFPVASGGEQGHSSAARQQRPQNKRHNRGHRGAGGGGSPEGSGSRGPRLLSISTRLLRTIPRPPDRGRVERLHNELCRWTRVPPLLRRQWRRRRCRQQQRRARCLPLHRG